VGVLIHSYHATAVRVTPELLQAWRLRREYVAAGWEKFLAAGAEGLLVPTRAVATCERYKVDASFAAATATAGRRAEGLRPGVAHLLDLASEPCKRAPGPGRTLQWEPQFAWDPNVMDVYGSFDTRALAEAAPCFALTPSPARPPCGAGTKADP